MLLQIVSLNIDELGWYFIYSLPSLQTCQSKKLWAFTICNLKVPTPLGVAQTTIRQKICLNEKHVFVEATPLWKCPCKKLFTVKVEKLRNQKKFSKPKLNDNSYSKSKTETRKKINTMNFDWSKKSIVFWDLRMWKKGEELSKNRLFNKLHITKILFYVF